MDNAHKTYSTNTTPCPYCQISGAASSRYRDQAAECLKNRNGTCFGCQKLSDIDRKIEEARRALKTLLHEREALASVLNKHHDPLSHRLPIEIMSRIFLNCLPPKPEKIKYDEKKLIQSVFLPGHVSKYWRKVARGTPKLWSTICVTISQSNCLTSVPFVREWLELSGGLPLFVQFFVSRKSNDVVSSVSQKIIMLLVQQAHRWQVLNLAVPGDFLPWMSCAVKNHNLNRLEHVKLVLTSTQSDNLDATSVLHLQATPRRLTQGNVPLKLLSINRENLTHFFASQRGLTMDECIELLQAAPCLQVCHLWSVEGSASSDVVVNCPTLQTLSVSEVPGEWWNKFTFPCLQILCIVYSCDESWTNLQSLLHRSGCKLKEISITETEYDDPDMVEVLKLTPDLQELDLYGDVIKEPFFSLMDEAASSMTTPTFLKNLNSLSCAIADEDFNWTWLLVFLTTMTTRQDRSLQSFTFKYLNKISDEPKAGTLQEKKTFNLLLDILKDVEFEVVDGEDLDLVELLRSHHNV